MRTHNLFAEWKGCYLSVTHQALVVTIAIALIAVSVSCWATFAGLKETERLASMGPQIISLSQRLTGTSYQIILLLLLTIRTTALLSKKPFGYLVAVVVLVCAVLTFARVYVLSDQVLSELERQHILAERPLAFFLGAPAGGVIPYVIALFLSVAGELAILLIASLRCFVTGSRRGEVD